MLAVLIASVLRYSEEDRYTFASAFHIPTYLFMSLVVAMFLGLTNSADEIIRDRHMLNRERNHNLRTFYYLCGKVLSLGTFALVQCVIYLLIGNWILEIREMFTIHLGWMFATSLTGVFLGLLVSSLVHDSRTALNTIPLMLIPQIILGGALIKYEEMNKNLDLVYSVRRWIEKTETPDESASKLNVPFVCQFMPLRWSYEAMLISQSKLNPLTRNQDILEDQIQQIVDLPREVELTDEQRKKLDLAKQSLAIISGLRADRPEDISSYLKMIRNAVLTGQLDQALLDTLQAEHKGTSAEEIYVNRKVLDLVTKAEMEREDYRRRTSPNVFFGTVKRYFDTEFNTLWINGVVIILSLAVVLATIHVSLRRQLTKV